MRSCRADRIPGPVRHPDRYAGLPYRTGPHEPELTITIAYLVNFLLRVGQHGPAQAVLIIFSALSVAALGVSGYLDGKLAFHYGLRVANEETQAAGFDIAPTEGLIPWASPHSSHGLLPQSSGSPCSVCG
ncbi:hypothetical protein GCM10023346_37910 [Arthrobacter gyeryongensis]|uniref:Uncharacterized protein n=1 Tax=Arthrobacter gyeryongensis TaxID=1650592 RepID=A0ABP9SNP5_9MICC